MLQYQESMEMKPEIHDVFAYMPQTYGDQWKAEFASDTGLLGETNEVDKYILLAILSTTEYQLL